LKTTVKRIRIVPWAVLLALAVLAWLRQRTPERPASGSDRVPAEWSGARDLTRVPLRPIPEPAAGPSPAPFARAADAVAAEADAASAEEDGAWPPGAIRLEYVASFFSARDRDDFLALARARGFEILDTLRLGHAVRLRAPSRAAWQSLLAEGPAPTGWGNNFHVRVPQPAGETPAADGDVRQPSGTYTGFYKDTLAWLGAGGRPAEWGAGVRVAVLDSGIGSHPSLKGADMVREGGFATDADPAANPHGTAVASLIVGNAAGAAGLAPSASLTDYAVVGAGGVGDLFTLCRAIVEAVDGGARVINVSLGSAGSNYLLESAVSYAVDRDVLIVAAVGNDGAAALAYPAALEGVAAVGAVDAGGRHLYFSNRGAGVDIAAPGLQVAAAWAGEGDALFSGTSAAAPLVSGAVAALLSQDAALSAAEAFALLAAYADDRGVPGADAEYGNGILNMGRVEERDTPGVYDVGVGDPYLVSTGGGAYDLAIWVQNRGTEALRAVSLDVVIDGVATSAGLFNIPVGGTASRRYAVNAASLAASGQVRVVCRASIDGQTDRNPADNGLSVTIDAVRTQP
jgi:hypothetical protein